MSAEHKRLEPIVTAAMRSVLDAVSDGVVVLDRDRRVVFMNRSARQLLGYDAAGPVGAQCSEALDTTDCANNCPLTRLETRGEPAVDVEMIYRGVGDRSLAASSTFEVLTDASGQVIGAVEVFRDMREVRRLEEQLYGRLGLGRLVGKSCAMRRVYELVEAAAATAAPVLVSGETGTGKDLVARAIHDLSTRSSGPFVPVNCATLSERALGRELFGGPRGRGAGPGRIAEAASGTLLLEDVDRLGPAIQEVTLRAITDGGATARIIATTSRDIEAAVERGSFCRELFYLLNAASIHVPPLRDRLEDVPLLVDHFVKALNQRTRTRYVEDIAPEAIDVLCGHAYPANVRELEHAVEHAFTRCRGKVIRLDHLPGSVTAPVAESVTSSESEPSDSIELLERDFMQRVLEENDWRLNAVADQLGLSRTTLWRKLRRLGLEKSRRGRA
jgi:PAS domain S-box-containing protein